MRKLNIQKMRNQLARSGPKRKPDFVLYYQYFYTVGPVSKWDRFLDKIGFGGY